MNYHPQLPCRLALAWALPTTVALFACGAWSDGNGNIATGSDASFFEASAGSSGTAQYPLDSSSGDVTGSEPPGSDAPVDVQPDRLEAGVEADSPALPPPAIPLTRCDLNWTVNTTIGESGAFRLLVDTGSTALAVASTECSECAAAGVTPLYQPGQTAVYQNMNASATYADVPPSSWSGDVYQDSVQLEGFSQTVPVKLVAITQQTNFFKKDYRCDLPNSNQGIIGLGPKNNVLPGTTSLLDRLVATSSTPDVFATQLCPDGGSLWLGGHDPARTAGPPQFTPMSKSPLVNHAYSVDLTEVQIAGASLGLSPSAYGPAIVDSGSSGALLATEVFSAVTARIGQDPTFSELFGGASWFSWTPDCRAVNLTKAELDAALPSLTLILGSDPPVSVQSPATESYLEAFNDGSGGIVYCPGVFEDPGGASFQFDLGASFMIGKVTIYDRQQNRIGFAPAPCP